MKSTQRSRTQLATVVIALGAVAAAAQAPPVIDAAARRIALERLPVVGSVLYIAAHPDDENNALLAYFAKGRKVRTAYLALTRGDGGQNLIGTEQGELLGVLRTEELLDARAVDGAEQFFTRAVDFGYSKTPEETLRIWGHDAVLSDMVWVIRSFRPDVIITRFPVNGGGHGHHTASAILASEAFRAAADPTRFPEQLRYVKPWQATRLLWNVFNWPGVPLPPGTHPQLAIDLGAYDSLLGESYTEIAATARTMHKSQGAAIPPRRGRSVNEFELVAGQPATHDVFDGIDLTWNRIPGAEAVQAALDRALAAYSDERPAAAVPGLLQALAAIEALHDGPWQAYKRTQVLEAIRDCTGLWLDAVASEPNAVPGGPLKLAATALLRADVPLALERIELPFGNAAVGIAAPLPDNEAVARELTVNVPRDAPLSQPYWLTGPHTEGAYPEPDQRLVGAPHSPPAIAVTFVLRSGTQELRYEVPATYRWLDPVEGQRSRRVAIVPRATVNLEAPVLLFPDRSAKTVRATVQAHAPETTATVALEPPAGWRAEPERASVTLARTGDEKLLAFTLTPPAAAAIGRLVASVTTDRTEAAHAFVVVDHPHIVPQTLLPLTSARLVRVETARPVTRVGYAMGAGDEVPTVLRQLGIDVTLLSDDDLVNADLSGYQAIVTGVRAYNTRPVLAEAEDRLLAYVRGGGTLLVQYNNNRELVTDRLGPFPLKLSRDRTTDETAAVTVLVPTSPWLTRPNPIGAADFDGWVQERGLYYPATWDAHYEAMLAMADPGEQPVQGALLVTHVGRGAFVYTGLSFFRQLPAGVPGAIRLFVDLLAGGHG
jgi:LmbE family N-acetylglucosaminyl deacetylase